jgi:ABC-type bacteriocin/lantibiotic exporter with double-glycine peptidase domain
MKLLKRKKSKFVYQNSESDCGVACLRTVLRFYGLERTDEEIRRMTGTTTFGTTLLGLYEAACQLGFKCNAVKVPFEEIGSFTFPAILHIKKVNNLNHYIVVLGLRKMNDALFYEIFDPAIGLEVFSETDLRDVWQTNVGLNLEVNDKFQAIREFEIESRRDLWHVVKSDWTILYSTIVVGIVISVLGVIMAVFNRSLIDRLLPQGDLKSIWIGIAMLAFLLFLKELISAFRNILLVRQGRDSSIRLVSYLYSKMVGLPMDYFAGRKVGDVMARIEDAGRIQKAVSSLFGIVAIDAVIVLFSLIVTFYYSIEVGLFLILSIPLMYGITRLNRNTIKSSQHEVMSFHGYSFDGFMNVLTGVADVKNFGKEGYFSAKVIDLYTRYQSSNYRFGVASIRQSFLLQVASTFFLLFVVLVGSYNVIESRMTIGEFFAILTLCGSMLPSLYNLMQYGIAYSDANISFDRVSELVNFRSDSATTAFSVGDVGAIEIVDLSYRYPGRSQLLKRVNMSICKGSIVCVVGANGSGKSTLVSVLNKSVVNFEGDIIIGDTSIKKIGQNQMSKILCVLRQDVHLFGGDILSNIALDDCDSQRKKAFEFLENYGFLSFFEKLPQNVFTVIGDRGYDLSSGQRQLIAFARALFHDFQFFILDEAMSALDFVTERFVFGLMESLKKDKGFVVITHKLHDLVYCDRLYELDKGELFEIEKSKYIDHFSARLA